MHVRRYARLTNAHSKKVAHHEAIIVLFVAWYNFCRKHETLKGKTPAMAAGLATAALSVEDFVDYGSLVPPPLRSAILWRMFARTVQTVELSDVAIGLMFGLAILSPVWLIFVFAAYAIGRKQLTLRGFFVFIAIEAAALALAIYLYDFPAEILSG